MIITIGRQHGSNGHDIARALAGQLGYACYDKEIVDLAAEHSSFSKEVFASYDEKRISNFLLWQSAYTELIFTDRLWPDFTEKDIDDAIAEYRSRSRRFG